MKSLLRTCATAMTRPQAKVTDSRKLTTSLSLTAGHGPRRPGVVQRASYEPCEGIMGAMVPSLLLAAVGVLVAIFLMGTRHPSTIELQVRDDHLDIHITGKDAMYALS